MAEIVLFDFSFAVVDYYRRNIFPKAPEIHPGALFGRLLNGVNTQHTNCLNTIVFMKFLTY